MSNKVVCWVFGLNIGAAVVNAGLYIFGPGHTFSLVCAIVSSFVAAVMFPHLFD